LLITNARRRPVPVRLRLLLMSLGPVDQLAIRLVVESATRETTGVVAAGARLTTDARAVARAGAAWAAEVIGTTTVVAATAATSHRRRTEGASPAERMS
jgi:hypothetical protein